MQELDACSCEGKRFVHLENIQVLAFKASDAKNETNRLTFQCTSYIMDHSRQRQKIWVLDRERTVVTLFVADDNINIHYDLLDTCVQKVHLSIWTRLQNCGVEVFDFYNTESLLTVVCDMKCRCHLDVSLQSLLIELSSTNLTLLQLLIHCFWWSCQKLLLKTSLKINQSLCLREKEG